MAHMGQQRGGQEDQGAKKSQKCDAFLTGVVLGFCDTPKKQGFSPNLPCGLFLSVCACCRL